MSKSIVSLCLAFGFAFLVSSSAALAGGRRTTRTGPNGKYLPIELIADD